MFSPQLKGNSNYNELSLPSRIHQPLIKSMFRMHQANIKTNKFGCFDYRTLCFPVDNLCCPNNSQVPWQHWAMNSRTKRPLLAFWERHLPCWMYVSLNKSDKQCSRPKWEISLFLQSLIKPICITLTKYMHMSMSCVFAYIVTLGWEIVWQILYHYSLL